MDALIEALKSAWFVVLTSDRAAVRLELRSAMRARPSHSVLLRGSE